MVKPFSVLARRMLLNRMCSVACCECRLVTDNGNYIIDLRFPEGISNPKEMDKELKLITGVVDHGLFIDMAHSVGLGMESGLMNR